eukprot:gb/GECH01013233.1/.p1 GENE.gb/GECH01013233.1/~~gb/GECH01013233.1/.p1  ORF type:complete len:239 (+),score=31.02 gb/GECH01013233.1/:1-717(+)
MVSPFTLRAVRAGSRYPINVATATFLDPRRYSRSIVAWIWLLVIAVLHGCSLQWIRYAVRPLRKRVDFVRSVVTGRLWKPFFWASIKEDYHPSSVRDVLHAVRRGDATVPPLVVRGASYTTLPNIVHAAIHDNTYKMLHAREESVWRSRYIGAWERQQQQGHDLDPEQPSLVDHVDEEGFAPDSPVRPNEFRAHPLDDFVREIEQQRLPLPQLETPPEIEGLQEVEQDRVESVKRLLQ